MTGPVRVGVVGEDLGFADFLGPWIDRIAADRSIPTEVVPAELTHACRPAQLRNWLERLEPRCDLLVVGADSGGSTHARTTRSYRRKVQDMAPLVDARAKPVVLAVAEPSVEAWLIADPSAFADGITAGTGVRFRVPAVWPRPRGERDAKEALGRLLAEGLGEPLLRNGFEFAPEIVRRMTPGSSESLDAWVREFERTLSSVARGR